MINFTVYSADCVGNSGNCLYPNELCTGTSCGSSSFRNGTRKECDYLNGNL